MYANSFTVIPMSQRFSLDPGNTYTGKISIAVPVDATEDFSFLISVSPYNVIGEDYTADLANKTGRNKIVDWITFEEKTGTVRPNEVKEIPFTISVPDSAAPGGQYAAIAVTAAPAKSESSGVTINTIYELASVIYANVSGEIVHDGSILENSVPAFSATTPVTVSALLENNGNSHEDATFSLSVTNFFTGETIYPTEEGKGSYTELVMPESSRYITRDIANLPALGVVHVNQTIFYNGDYSSVEKNILICPIWFLIMVLLSITTIITFIVHRIRHRHKKILF